MVKTCTACGVEKTITEFHKRTYKSGKVSTQSKCKTCQKSDRKKYYKPHSSIRLSLGLSQEEVDRVIGTGQCQACGTTDRRLCIDHNHTTNQVRGLLCQNCNTALGLVGDDIGILENLINYLNNDRNNCS